MGLGNNPGMSGFDDCGKGSMCWDIDEDSGIGYCVEFCQGSVDAALCPKDIACATFSNGVLPLCLPTKGPV